MSFASILQQIVEGCGGGRAAVLMGSDGIAIAQAGAAEDVEAAEETSVLGVELGRILDELRKVADSAGTGALGELQVRFGRAWVLLHPVDEETYVVLALAPHGNLGKARFLLRRHRLALRDEL